MTASRRRPLLRGGRIALVLAVFLSQALACDVAPFAGSECRPFFSLPASSEPYLEFLAAGDTGTGDDNQAAVAGAMGQFASDNNPAFALLLGDNFYPDGVSSTTDAQWQTTFEQVYSSTNLDFPFYAVLGNHDYHENENAQVAYTTAVPASRWEMPARYYTFSKTLSDLTIDFFALDTNTIKTEDAQLEWLEDQLSASTADWKIVFAHHPLYSNGVHGTDPALVDRLLPLFEQYGVDLYLCGHDHDLQVLQAVNGVHFLVDGAGSAHRLTRCLDNTLYAASQLGFMAFRVSQQELVLMVILSDGSLDFALEITH